MAKRYRLLRKGYNPAQVAETVIDHWASGNVAEWAARYQEGVAAAQSDGYKLAQAKAKLTAWYNILLKHRAEISRIMNQAKQEYLAMVTRGAAPAPTPAVRVPAV